MAFYRNIPKILNSSLDGEDRKIDFSVAILWAFSPNIAELLTLFSKHCNRIGVLPDFRTNIWQPCLSKCATFFQRNQVNPICKKIER